MSTSCLLARKISLLTASWYSTNLEVASDNEKVYVVPVAFFAGSLNTCIDGVKRPMPLK